MSSSQNYVFRYAAITAAFATGAALTHFYYSRKARRLQRNITPGIDLSSTSLLAAVEMGGTTCRAAVAFADDPSKPVDIIEIETTDPRTTMSGILRFLRSHAPFVALGVASFGPIDLNRSSKTYGYITSTAKPGWQNTNLLSFFEEFQVPINFDTDVNAPAIAELRYGKHDGESCAYITVGTGIGVGLVVNGAPVHGLVHPDGGHVMALRKENDFYPGWLAIHPLCVESMASARACADRTGVQPKALPRVSDEHPAWDDIAYYLAQLCFTICLIASPHVIVMSGGVMKRSILFDRIRSHFIQLNNGYISSEKLTTRIHEYIVPSAFGNDIGIVGAIELARRAAIGIS